MDLSEGREHWDRRYREVGADAVSWYQEVPEVSLALIDALALDPSSAVLDVGGGASTLVDHLLRRGFDDLTVLDLSGAGLAAARGRLGDDAPVTWVEGDVLTWDPPRFELWHDRALLHFLVDEADRSAYVRVLRRALTPGGAFVIGTFAPDAPPHCSGLPVRRHDVDDLVALLGEVDVVEARRELHRTPAGAEQPFTWIAGRLSRR